MNSSDKRHLLKSLLQIIGDPDDVQGMYDFQIDKLMEEVTAANGEETNVEEIFDVPTIKDWVSDNFALLYPTIDKAICVGNYPQKTVDNFIKTAARQFRIDAVYSRKEIDRFVRED
jgi:hypothetical protein